MSVFARLWCTGVIVVLAVGIAFVVGACASGGGGGGGGGGGDKGPDPLGGSPAARGCADPSPSTGGVNELPNYAEIPAPSVPRFIREGERLAEGMDLSTHVPTPCDQGPLNSCVGWAGGYGLMTYLAAESIDGWVGLDDVGRQFSPVGQVDDLPLPFAWRARRQ